MQDQDFVPFVQYDPKGYYVTLETFVGNVGEVTFIAGKNAGWDFEKAEKVLKGVQEMLYNK